MFSLRMAKWTRPHVPVTSGGDTQHTKQVRGVRLVKQPWRHPGIPAGESSLQSESLWAQWPVAACDRHSSSWPAWEKPSSPLLRFIGTAQEKPGGCPGFGSGTTHFFLWLATELPHLYLAPHLSNTLGVGMPSRYSGVFLGVMGCCHNNCLLDLTVSSTEGFSLAFQSIPLSLQIPEQS